MQRMQISSVFVIGLLFFLSSPVHAEQARERAMELDEVLVTATRTERSLEDIPAAVDVVNEEEINNTRMFGLKEALTGIPGVQAESKNGGYDARLIIRGAGLKARYGVREIMILLDGVPITDPDGMSRLDFVDSETVERIDIVKGPNSTLYGANAAGGVINIITRNPFEEKKSLKAGYGSDNTQVYNGVYGTHFGDTYCSLSGSRRSTDSWREWNSFSTNQGALKVGHLFGEQGSLEANISITKADLQLPGTLTQAQFEGDISQLTSEQWRNMGRYSNILSTSLKGEKVRGNIKIKPLAYFQKWTHFHPVTGLINDGGARVYGADIQADISHDWRGMAGVATVGIAGQVDKSDGEKYTYRDFVTSGSGRLLFTTSDVKGDLAETAEETTGKWGIYLQESLEPTKKWIVDLGVRYDRVNFDIDLDQFREFNYSSGRYVLDNATIRRDKPFERVSPRVGILYKMTPVVHLYGNIATGFQTPQASELEENPDLFSSKTTNYETGLKARFPAGHSIDLALYAITVKDDIVQSVLPDNQQSYSNAGKTRKKGVELSARLQARENCVLGGAYAYSDFTYAEFNEVISGRNFSRNGNRLPYIPRHQYSLFGLYKHASGLRFKVETNTWGTYEVDNANSETYDGYSFMTNALVGYERKGFDLSVDVANLFDKTHAIEVTKDSSGTTKYRPGAPRTWMVRVSCNF